MPPIAARVYAPTYALQHRLLGVVSSRARMQMYRRKFLEEQSRVRNEVLVLVRRAGRDLGPFVQSAIGERLYLLQMQAAKRFVDMLVHGAVDVQVKSLQSFFKGIRLLERAAGGDVAALDEQAAFNRAKAREGLITRRMREPLVKILAMHVRRVEQRMGAAILGFGDIDDALDDIERHAEQEWWKVERIIRTVFAAEFNEARVVAIGELANTFPVMLRWMELVDDATGLPLDDHVYPDSIQLHGQVVKPGGVFTMPPHVSVRRDMWNQKYRMPPNRPNDRSVLVPWRPGWGVPAWSWEDGRKVPL